MVKSLQPGHASVIVVMLLLVVLLTLSGYEIYYEWGGEALTDLLEKLQKFW